MKRIFILSLLIALAIAACSNGTTDSGGGYPAGTVITVGSYATEAPYTEYACYWVNDTTAVPLKIPATAEYSGASAITVAGGKVYIAGYYGGDDGDVVCYWVDDGEAIKLKVPAGVTGAEAYDITVIGSNVYVAGYYWLGGKRNACYWKNDEEAEALDMPAEATKGSNAYSIAVWGGKVYLAGSYYKDEYIPVAFICEEGQEAFPVAGDYSEVCATAEKDGIGFAAGYYDSDTYTKACYWEALESTPIPLNSPLGTAHSHAYALAIEGVTPYFAGKYMPSSGDGTPCYWVGTGMATDLKLPSAAEHAEAYAIALSGGKVYTAGYYYDGTYDNACYWVDDTEVVSLKIPSGTEYSQANGIAVIVE